MMHNGFFWDSKSMVKNEQRLCEKNKGGQKSSHLPQTLAFPPGKLLKHLVVYSFPQSLPHSLRMCM